MQTIFYYKQSAREKHIDRAEKIIGKFWRNSYHVCKSAQSCPFSADSSAAFHNFPAAMRRFSLKKKQDAENRVLSLFLRYCLEWQCPEQPAQPPPQLPLQVLFPCFFWRMRYRIMEMTTAKRTAEMRMVARLALNHVSMENHSFGKEWK